MPARSCSKGVDIAGWPTHRIARQGVGIVFQHSRPLHRQTVLENIKLALLPDSRCCGSPRRRALRRGRARSPSASGSARCCDRSAHPALRRSAPPGARQGDRARSEGGAGRRAVRRPDRGRGRAFLRADRRLPRRRARGAARRPQREERRGARRPRARHVSRRADRRGHAPRR